MEKSRVKVSIAGKEYSIVSSEDHEYIEKAARYLDSRMKEISENYPQIPEVKVAVLAAMNITDELFQIKKLQGNFEESDKRIGELARKISEVL